MEQCELKNGNRWLIWRASMPSLLQIRGRAMTYFERYALYREVNGKCVNREECVRIEDADATASPCIRWRICIR